MQAPRFYLYVQEPNLNIPLRGLGGKKRPKTNTMNPAITNAFRVAVETLKESAIPKAQETVANVAQQMVQSVEDYITSTVSHIKSDVKYIDVEFLDKATFMQHAMNCKCAGANGLAALTRLDADGKGGYIYLANVKDRDLIAMENNKYVIIKADLISAEVKELWDNCNLIILQ